MALNTRQQAFVEAYLANGFNATRAAITAGYSEKTAYSIGSENLRKPEIADEVKRRITEMTMSADEALIRLSEQARSTLEDFTSIRYGQPVLDLEKAMKNGKMHLLKKFKTGKAGVEIELHDVQSALVHILKEQHLMAGEATDIVDDASLTDDTRATRITSLLDAARARRDGRADSEYVQ